MATGGTRDDLLRAFVARGKNRRQKGYRYRPEKQGALPKMEGGYMNQQSTAKTPRVKRGGYLPPKAYSPAPSAAAHDVANAAARHDVANSAARSDVASRQRKRRRSTNPRFVGRY